MGGNLTPFPLSARGEGASCTQAEACATRGVRFFGDESETWRWLTAKTTIESSQSSRQ